MWQAVGRIDEEGVWLEELEADPAQYLPEVDDAALGGSSDVVAVDLDRPMDQIRQQVGSSTPQPARL